MSNGRHHHRPTPKTDNHVPLWRRIPSWRRLPQWVGVAGLLAGLLVAGGEHAAHLLTDDQHSRAAEAAPAVVAPEVVVELSVPDACLQALSHAEDGLDLGTGHIKDMVQHIEETGAVGRDHNKEMRKLVDRLDKIRDRFEQARLGCQLQPAEPTTGGE